MAVTERQLRDRIVAGGGYVGHVRVDLEPQGVHLAHDRHAARQRFGQGDVHVFQRKHDAGLAGPLGGPAQPIDEAGHTAFVALLIEDIVAGDLDDAHPHIRRKLDRLAHDGVRTGAHLGRRAAQRILAMPAQAHAQNGHTGRRNAATKVCLRCSRPVEPGQPFVGFVNRHLDEVIPGLGGHGQSLIPRPWLGQRLLVKANRQRGD